ncbi:ABC transporter permease [Actinoallomurus liliacearum]|uniref:ABC transporter permease n=1 Tax=Actinoallomurus liliacearum TaxID=1080073 RepID=UPI0031E5040A
MVESGVDAPTASPGDTAPAGPSRQGRPGVARVVRGAIGVLVFLVLWEIIGRAGIVDRTFLPPSSDVLRRLVTLAGDGGFLQDVAATLAAWGSGLLIATLIAVPAGLLLGSVPGINSAVRVLVEFLRPIPGVALIPLALLVIPEQAALERTLAVYASMWPIMINAVYAVGEVDPVAREMAKCFGVGRFGMLLRIALPSVAPFIATGVRVASGITLIVIVSTELIAGGGEHGLGMFIINASADAEHGDLLYAGVAAVGLLGFLIDVLMRQGERRLFRWHYARQEGR